MSRSCDYLDFDLGMNSPTSEVYLDIKIFTRSCFLSNINESEPIKIMRFHFCALFSFLPRLGGGVYCKRVFGLTLPFLILDLKNWDF